MCFYIFIDGTQRKRLYNFHCYVQVYLSQTRNWIAGHLTTAITITPKNMSIFERAYPHTSENLALELLEDGSMAP